ncbi:MAG: hypothetical protein PVI44_13115 [Balneolaceae bacterium]|jgi:hypothetical protein
MKLLQKILPAPLTCAFLLLLFTGCDVTGSNSGGKSQVAVNMKIQSTAAPKLKSGSSTIQAVDSLIEVKLLVKKLELKNSMEEDSLDFEVRDFVADLPLDGSAYAITSAQVPTGVYDKFEVKIHKPENGSTVQDTSFFNNSGNSEEETGYSIVIRGISNGEKFTYKSNKDFELEMELNPPLEVTDTTSASVAINIDPASWFKDSAGNALDPNNPDNQEAINENIRQSFHAEHEEHDSEHDSGNENNNEDSENGAS